MSETGHSIETFSERWREAVLAVFDSNVPTFFRPHEREEFSAFLDELPGPYYVVLGVNDDVVSCGGYAVRDEEPVGDLCWGMVRADLHGQGLGRSLTQVRIDRIVADAGDEVEAICLQTSHETAGFYERMGFSTTRVVEDGFGPGLHRHDMVRKVLPTP